MLLKNQSVTLSIPNNLSVSQFIGMKIRLARVAKGLSQNELAALLHVCQGTIWGWESGTFRPCLESFESLAAQLGQPYEYFISELSGSNKMQL